MFTDWNWERAVVAELQREHALISRSYKIYLRPVTVVVADLGARWGQYDHRARTITLARRLVSDYRWDQVVGIFRHEVAHQIVMDSNSFAEPAKPHGEEFKRACRQIGLSAAYARPGIEFGVSPPDWRLDAADPVTERILDRVKKLLALATSGNQHEALLAMARVRELYARHNLEHASEEQEFVHLVIDEGKRRLPSWEHAKLALIGEHFFVRILTFAQYQPRSGLRAQAIEMIGTRENVLMAEYVFYFLRVQVEALLKRAVRERGLAGRERASFRLGVLHGFSEKLAAAENTTATDAAGTSHAPTEVGKALVQFRGVGAIDTYVSSIHPDLVRRRGAGITVERDAYADGQREGARLNLNRPLSSREISTARLSGANRAR